MIYKYMYELHLTEVLLIDYENEAVCGHWREKL